MSINPFASMYGPGVLNDTIVLGYGVTLPPVNLDTFWQLPNRTTRNFGEATQYTTYPMGRPQFMYDFAQNFTAPNHISNWDPMLLSTGINFNSQTTNPYLTQQGQMDAYNWGANMVQQMQIQQAIQGIAGALNSMESSLSNIIKSDKLTNAQKAELKGLLEEVKALKSKIEKQLKAKNPSQEEVIDMQKEVQELQKKVSDAADKIRAEVSEAGDSSSSSSSSASSSSSSSSSSDTADLTGTEYEKIDPETGRPTELGDVPSNSEISQFCSTINGAVSGSGTKNDVLAAAISGLNANNIVEVVANWEKNYGKHTEDGNAGFFARIFDDIGDDDQRKYVPIMLDALQKRAEALGIADEIQADADAVLKELHNNGGFLGMYSWTDDHKLANGLMAIYDKIVEKEAANKTGAKEALDNKKTENETKANERKQEVITEKKNEIANKLKDALKLKEVPQLSSLLKIETDDNGEFTGYSIELDTQNGKVKVTGQTYQELVLAIEKNNLSVEDVLIRDTQA